MELPPLLWPMLATLILIFIMKRALWMLSHRLPPGPWGFPLLGYLPFSSKLLLNESPNLNYKKLAKKYGRIYGKEGERHMRDFDENNLDDFTAYYLNDMKKNTSSKTSLTLANLLGNSQGLMFAGTDSTRITITWVVLHLAHYQEFQEKIYKEIVTLLGKEKPPSLSDKDDLPFTNAFIWESARVKTLAPSDDPRWSTKDGTIGGYFIPKDSIVLPNVEAVHNDKKLWGDPQNFRPERFLSADGKMATLPEYWIPFLIGKRVCPGAKLANMQIFLFVASMVQNFHIVAPKSGLNIESQYIGLTFPVKPVVSFNRRT